MEFINNLKAERSGKKIDVELLEGELADDVRSPPLRSVLRYSSHGSALYWHSVKLAQLKTQNVLVYSILVHPAHWGSGR